jgi:GNAT superfamily N-acetyltransferase
MPVPARLCLARKVGHRSIMVVQQSVYPLRPVQAADRAASATLLKDVMGGSEVLWRARLEHWDRNPAFTASAARGWVATSEGDRIVAYMANAPFDYGTEDGARFVGMAAHTLAVRPEARGKGVARSLTHAEFLEPCDFSVGVQTSPGGWAATLAGGGVPMGQEWVRKPRLVILDPGAFLRRMIRRRRALPQPPESEDAGLKNVDVEVIASFRAQDDPQLTRMIARPARVRPVRDAERLNWLYFGTQRLQATRLVLGLRRRGNLLGYAGFRVLPHALVLLECRRMLDDVEVTKLLLAAACRLGRRRRLSHLLAYAYSADIEQALRPWSIPAIGSRRFPYAIAVKNAALKEKDLELGPWDGDAVFADDAHLFA